MLSSLYPFKKRESWYHFIPVWIDLSNFLTDFVNVSLKIAVPAPCALHFPSSATSNPPVLPCKQNSPWNNWFFNYGWARHYWDVDLSQTLLCTSLCAFDVATAKERQSSLTRFMWASCNCLIDSLEFMYTCCKFFRSWLMLYLPCHDVQAWSVYNTDFSIALRQNQACGPPFYLPNM